MSTTTIKAPWTEPSAEKGTEETQDAKQHTKDSKDKEVWLAHATAQDQAATSLLVHDTEPCQMRKEEIECESHNRIQKDVTERRLCKLIVFDQEPNEVHQQDYKRGHDADPELEHIPLLEARFVFLQSAQLPRLKHLAQDHILQ